MKQEFVELLRCPRCWAHLELTTFVETTGGDEIIDGVLRCGCGASYPIVDAIPRILTGAYSQFPAFVERYRSLLNDISEETEIPTGRFERMQAETQRSFGYQWTTFSEMATDFKENFWNYLYPATPEFFEGKLGLDVGCGFGRHIYHAASCGTTMVGVDFSSAIESTYANTKHLPNVHLVQADIYAMPFQPSTFDFAYSVGVLHHLPDPSSGLKGLLPLIKPGGTGFIWVYSSARRFTNAVLEGVRVMTSKMPPTLIKTLSFVGAVVDRFGFIFPYHVLRQVPGLKTIVERITPPRIKLYHQYPFQVLYADWFDRLAAPIRFYYSKSGTEELMQAAGFVDIQVTATGFYGWRGRGIRPRDV